ncbi:malto-oligosyltrehalose trehalohydrolase [Halotalea alkalilenta]|uniref:Malto-oligosyltrehalose trehalohydrolase n=1 Tax=Halotalea alkalilenta TaxID=376489 RepID=A0A172YIJ8_9GAMM|nr:malto-oligosyltrehalose trehalohydrolase [Halotalea alkalilenta]ANF59044.1 malto-oligosyltrehalose trehalohydrolase [Halotalea alkalilenta]
MSTEHGGHHRSRAFGVTDEDDGLRRFALWAPDAERVSLVLDADSPSPRLVALEDRGEGHFEVRCAAAHGTPYRFRINDDFDVPDPAARASLDGPDSPGLIVDTDYPWRHGDWRGRAWRELVVYELHVGVLGGFNGVRDRLEALAELGITAIELMPISECPGQRNWGYDGVLPYAVESSYGTPAELKSLIDVAHGLGISVLLDVVYNHFGPDGNHLPRYASAFFRDDATTPWGAMIDFRRREVRDFFIDNAVQWIEEYRFDGLRFDAVHAINDRGFLLELSRRTRQAAAGRHLHLVLENEFNQASLLDRAEPDHFTAQWADDWHNAIHVLLTGEHEGYYADFAERPTERFARALAEGFVYQGEPTRHGEPRGESSAGLPPCAFQIFLQNHDQIGNRPLGERLPLLCPEEQLHAATVMLLLSPLMPLIFMGDEWGSEQPFLFFTDHHDQLADAVREGRRGEFAEFSGFTEASARARIPDPNAEATFQASIPDWGGRESVRGQRWLERYRTLLRLRAERLVPRFEGCFSLGAEVLAEAAVIGRWTLNDGQVLAIACNLGERVIDLPMVDTRHAALLYESADGGWTGLSSSTLGPHAALAWLEYGTPSDEAVAEEEEPLVEVVEAVGEVRQ